MRGPFLSYGAATVSRLIYAHCVTRVLPFVVYALAAARVTRLVTEDRILDGPRNAILKRLPDESNWAYLLGCRWCAGLWISIPAAAVAYWEPRNPWFLVPALALAFSYAVGWLSGHEGD